MNNLMVFEGRKVEVIELQGRILFNPYHVAAILGIKNVRENLRNFNENQVIKLTKSIVSSTDNLVIPTAGKLFLTESGVYKLIFKSRKPEAEKFSDWVTDEVLPNIRKTGSYGVSVTGNDEVIKMLAMSQKNMMDMIGQLSMTLQAMAGSFAQVSEQKYRDSESSMNIQGIDKLIEGQSARKKYKVLLLPKEVLEVVNILLSQDDRNFSFISRYLYKRGYNVSNVAVSNYFYNIFRG